MSLEFTPPLSGEGLIVLRPRCARTRCTVLPLVLAALLACEPGPRPGTTAQRGGTARTPPAGATLDSAEDAEWTMQAKDFANTRYSSLAQVDTTNAKNLRLAWTFSTGELRGHEGAPLVVGKTMYFVTPFPDVAFALDLTTDPPTQKWKYEPKPDPYAIGKACCDVVNRGWAYADGKLIYNLLDANTVAVDVQTGKEVWRTKMADVGKGITMTMAPFVVGSRVFVGNSGGEFGVPGWLAALDVATGKELWRAYSIGPDSMVRIDSTFRPFYSWMRGKDLGVKTWPPQAWQRGAGAAWGWISYDPELDLIYYGTSNPGPWNAEQRPGLNLWTSTIFARDPETGMARWAYQVTPHDQWDFDAVNENVLVDLPIGGRTRKVLVHFDRNAFAYVIDRQTGEVLSAEPFTYLNWATGINLQTGMPELVPEKNAKTGQWVRQICPTDIGGKDQQPSAYSPRTGLFYVPAQRICTDTRWREVSYLAGTPYVGAEVKRSAAPGGYRGEFIAWDPVAGRKVWGIPDKFIVYSGVLATGGDVVFYGTVDGWFRAVNARTGTILWQQKLGSGIIGAPMTYIGPDGKQYVSILVGIGGVATLMSDLPGYPPQGGMLYTFSL